MGDGPQSEQTPVASRSLTPIVALVDAETLTALEHQAAIIAPPDHPDVLDMWATNGWTHEMFVAGAALRAGAGVHDA